MYRIREVVRAMTVKNMEHKKKNYYLETNVEIMNSAD